MKKIINILILIIFLISCSGNKESKNNVKKQNNDNEDNLVYKIQIQNLEKDTILFIKQNNEQKKQLKNYENIKKIIYIPEPNPFFILLPNQYDPPFNIKKNGRISYHF